jgi:DNA primase
MSCGHFDSTEDPELRAKLDEAKRRLPLPELMKQLGLGGHAKKRAHCPWHDDKHPSFSIFQGKDSFWHYKCFVCDSCGGDEFTLLAKHFDISRREAIRRYLELAGFPTTRPKSR